MHTEYLDAFSEPERYNWIWRDGEIWVEPVTAAVPADSLRH
ncbi:MAG: hypothetical protein AB7E80_08895 [Hyphomicrobiaceae bacterium]